MQRKRRGKYVEGQEPWAILGIIENTFHARLKAEVKRELFNGPAHQAKQKALEIAAGASVETVEAGEVEEVPVEASAPVEPPVAPAAPDPVEALTTRAAAKIGPDTGMPPATPAGTPAAYQFTDGPAGTINVTFRCPPSVHNRMREMAHKHRVKLQGIVAAAVEAYLTANKF